MAHSMILHAEQAEYAWCFKIPLAGHSSMKRAEDKKAPEGPCR